VNLVGGNVDINNNNYRYTEIGELESDALEGIEEIIWRVDSKISEVRFVSSSDKDNLKFEYDAMGNRVAKYVMDGQTSFAKHVTFYVRDASGNVMAVYEHDLETPESYHLSERHIYGSSRVGMITEQVEFEYVYGNLPTEELVATLVLEETVNFELEYTIGSRQYELSNHLGNVLAVISDWKIPVISGASVVSYTTVVVSSQDYSPFGVTLSGRSWSAGYRYGFNGMEKDNETFSGAYDFGARILDVRLGRWLSADAFVSKHPGSSPYSFVWNSPLVFIDPTGNDGRLIIDYEKKQITLETTIYLHGDLSSEEMNQICDSWNKEFNAMDNSKLIRDPNDPNVSWNVTINVKFCFDENLNETCKKMGLNEGPITENAMESIENAEAYGIIPGDNLMRIEPATSSSHGYTGIGINEGVTSKDFSVGIHEVGHQLGFDERYLAYIIDNGVKKLNPTPFSVACYNLDKDFMSNGPLSTGNPPVISTFHFVDVLQYVLDKNLTTSSLVVGTVKEDKKRIVENSDGTVTEYSTSITKTHQFDDTNSGAGNVCDGVETKNKMEVKE
jgi:RHS repeat-associated protein